jgi:hypothetical protein
VRQKSEQPFVYRSFKRRKKPMKNIFSSDEPIREVDPSFATQANAQRGDHPAAPPTNNPFPVPMGHPGTAPALENLFAHAGPAHAATAEPTYSMPPTPHLSLRPDFENLAARSAPFSVLKRG